MPQDWKDRERWMCESLFAELDILSRDLAKHDRSVRRIVRLKNYCSTSLGLYTIQTKSVRHHVTCVR